MSRSPSAGATFDRALQLQAGDHVRVSGPELGDPRHCFPATVVAIRRSHGEIGVQADVRMHIQGAVITLECDHILEVLHAPSFLAERVAAAGKVCTACKDWHPLFSYYRNVKGLLGRHAWCMRCFKADQLVRQRARRAAARASA